MKVGSHLDYFTASYIEIKQPQKLNLSGPEFEAVERIRPIAHYDIAWRLKCGGTLNVAHEEQQGARIDLGGQALQYCRDAGMSDTDTVAVLVLPDGFKQVTRLDYCWDIENAGSVRHAVNHWQAGLCKTSLRGSPEGYINYGTRAGRTVYFGSKTSTQRIRIYDKGAEMKLINKALLRVEMQIRKPHAAAMHKDALKWSLPNAAQIRLKKLIDFPALQWWKKALSCASVPLTTIERKTPKWQAWLLGQVTESITAHHAKNEGNDREVIEQWLANLTKNLTG